MNLKVNLKDYSYDVVIEKGIINKVSDYISDYKKVFIITDKNVDFHYGNLLVDSLEKSNINAHKIVLQPGEQTKSIEVLAHVYDELVKAGISRSSLIIALGGGIIGDLAGFVAGTILRGVPFVQIPTSLLSQVDSSIGGKTGVNLDGGKNLVGIFNHPKLVLIDPNVLNTLPIKYLKDGLGEVIKYGCIKDGELFSKLCESNSIDELLKDIESIIYSCLSIKKTVVELDEKDTGERMLLNFGHTLGHGIEKFYKYKYSHGEAVSIGMYEITKQSEDSGLSVKGTALKIKELLKKYDLPYEIPESDKNEIVKYILHDKKILKNNLNLILLKEIGDSFIHPVDKDHIYKFFKL